MPVIRHDLRTENCLIGALSLPATCTSFYAVTGSSAGLTAGCDDIDPGVHARMDWPIIPLTDYCDWAPCEVGQLLLRNRFRYVYGNSG